MNRSARGSVRLMFVMRYSTTPVRGSENRVEITMLSSRRVPLFLDDLNRAVVADSSGRNHCRRSAARSLDTINLPCAERLFRRLDVGGNRRSRTAANYPADDAIGAIEHIRQSELILTCRGVRTRTTQTGVGARSATALVARRVEPSCWPDSASTVPGLQALNRT